MDDPPQFDPLHNLNEMASLISEVSGEPVEQARCKLQRERSHPGSTVAEDFARQGGPRYQGGPHLDAFYSSTNSFLYELAVWNRNRMKKKMRRWTARHLDRQVRDLDVLGIGDGLGFDCLHFCRMGHRVTYFDLPGLCERFARQLFTRTRCDVRVLTDPNQIPLESFDAITCFDVLEHVPDPPAMVKTLASYLRPGGHLYVSAPFFMILPWYPTHLKANRRFSGRLDLYQQAGLQLVDGQFAWQPLVLRKPDNSGPMRASPSTLVVRLAAASLMVGRFTSAPFLPIHFLRRLCNRPFEDTSGRASSKAI